MPGGNGPTKDRAKKPGLKVDAPKKAAVKPKPKAKPKKKKKKMKIKTKESR